MKIFFKELPFTEPCETFANFAHLPYSLFLDSADQTHPDARYSFIAAHPLETIETKDGLVTITSASQQTSFRADPFETIKEHLKAHKLSENILPDLPPFQGGAAGLFGYDLARSLEILPANAAAHNQPDMAVGIYDSVMAFDHTQKKAWIIVQAENEATAQEKQKLFLTPRQLQKQYQGTDVNWNSNFTAGSYKKQVQKVIDYILTGDIFQANLSQRFEAPLPPNFDSFAHYQHLRAINPAPFAAYMNLGDIQIASASPERFITVKNRQVETKPIKGTKPRLPGAADEAQKKALQSSKKDRAENIMIVDLLRNDLSKVCEADSIRVEKLCAVESFARVHHLVSTISGKLKEKHGPLDLLRACFPGGSITGAPKIRAMEIIDELEPQRRGAYCGSLGYIGANGTMDTNILIRTLVYTEQKVGFNVGGGITADSNPEEEYQETLDKAAGLFASFETQEKKKNRMILVIDNYDSFVHNLARHMELAGWSCKIARNDKITLDEIEAMKPQAIVMSPGPCTPQETGVCIDAIRKFGPYIPMLGVCLGHQCIGEAFDIKTVRADKPVHGKASIIHHNSDALFTGVSNPFRAGRYHSLIIKPGNVSPLIVTAQTADGEIMAVKHETHPVYGVQFHPESILTEQGMDIIVNFTAMAMAWNSKKVAA